MTEASKGKRKQYKREIIQGFFAAILFTILYAVWYEGMRDVVAIFLVFFTFFITWVLVTWIIYRIRIAKEKSDNKET